MGNIAAILVDVMALVQAGLQLKDIVGKVMAMEAAGKTPHEISTYLRQLRVDALNRLSAALAETEAEPVPATTVEPTAG